MTDQAYWKTLCQEAAGKIAAAEALQPDKHLLHEAAQPFLDYVATLGGDSPGAPALAEPGAGTSLPTL